MLKNPKNRMRPNIVTFQNVVANEKGQPLPNLPNVSIEDVNGLQYILVSGFCGSATENERQFYTSSLNKTRF